MQKLNEIKYKFYSHEKLTRDEIEYLIQEVERLHKGIVVAIGTTHDDDTWDYLNRMLENKSDNNLSYRVNSKDIPNDVHVLQKPRHNH